MNILQPLAISHSAENAWQQLLELAKHRHQLELPAPLEGYLLYVLMRYCQDPQLLSSILATELLQALQVQGRAQWDRLQVVGDKSLLLCGIFPELSLRRQVDMDYYVTIGRQAYGLLTSYHPIYVELTEQFVGLVNVLRAVRGINNPWERMAYSAYH